MREKDGGTGGEGKGEMDERVPEREGMKGGWRGGRKGGKKEGMRGSEGGRGRECGYYEGGREGVHSMRRRQKG